MSNPKPSANTADAPLGDEVLVPTDKAQQIVRAPIDKPECFVMMPISDHADYEKGHFRRVYEDIFRPACEKAGYTAYGYGF